MTQITNPYRRHVTLMMLIVIVITVAALLVSILRPVEYRASIAFSVNRINQQSTEEYQFDGYYAIQAADLFSQTVVSWFLTPSVLLNIYNEAGIEANITSLERFTSQFNAKKYSSQNIVVTFVESEQDRADKIANAVISVVELQATETNLSSEEQALFEIQGSAPVIVEHRTNTWLMTGIGFIAGWVIAIVIVSIIEYMTIPRRDEHRD